MTTVPNDGPRAFVIDDDPDFIDLIAHALRQLGISVESFATPEAFLTRLREHKPTLCVVDIHLGPLAVGYALVKAIRKVVGTELPLLVASANFDRATIAHAMEVGADDFIAKPVDIAMLAAKLKHYVSSRAIRKAAVAPCSIPPSEALATLFIEASVIGVDELGVMLESPHLLKKGMRLTIASNADGPLTKALGGRSIMAVVERTGLDPATGRFDAYAAFDPDDTELLERVRRWLIAEPS